MIPCFFGSIIAFIVQKQWKWLAFTLGNIVVFWIPELALAAILIPTMIVPEFAMQCQLVVRKGMAFYAWLPAAFFFVPCIQPMYMLIDSVRRKQSRGMIFASVMAVGMNLGWICFTALCVICVLLAI